MTLSDLGGHFSAISSRSKSGSPVCVCVIVVQDVVRAAFGRSGFVVLTIMQFLYPFIGKKRHRHWLFFYFTLRHALISPQLQ